MSHDPNSKMNERMFLATAFALSRAKPYHQCMEQTDQY